MKMIVMFEMKVVSIALAVIKLQFKLPQTLISRGFTRRTVLHAPAFQQNRFQTFLCFARASFGN